MANSSQKKSVGSNKSWWRGKKILITAGPTREYFDPVRFLSNPSSGKMGYALAEAALRKGARVTLISGPVSLNPPQGVRCLLVESAEEMCRAVLKESRTAEVIIMAAAVSDWRPTDRSHHKLKKSGKPLTVKLLPTRDILKELGRRKKRNQILVGFAAETDHLMRNAQKKLFEKKLDLIIANRVGEKKGGFESDTNRALLIPRNGVPLSLQRMSKKSLAKKIINFVAEKKLDF